jgi:hypothetical protein
MKRIAYKYCCTAIVLLLPFFLFSCELDTKSSTISEFSTPLPMIDGEWHRQGRIWIMELAHGWLVKRSQQEGGGLCFVPKPTFERE